MVKFLGDKRSSNERFAPLEMTTKLHKKISKFGTKAPVVEKTLTSFERFYQAANKLDDDLIQKHGKKLAAQVGFFKYLILSNSVCLKLIFRLMLRLIQMSLH